MHGEIPVIPPSDEVNAVVGAIPGVRFTPGVVVGQEGPEGHLGPEAAGAILVLHVTAVAEAAADRFWRTSTAVKLGSTEQATALGDRQWRALLESHDAVARALIGQHRGRLVKMTGDRVLATFDGPGRAIRCAFALRDALDPLGITIRAGLHTGEVEFLGDDIAGIGVHIAARVFDQACGGVARLVGGPLLVAGSGIEFEDRGDHELKGVGALRLYAVEV